jgi:DNA replication initiation complex subunit (GINS family)
MAPPEHISPTTVNPRYFNTTKAQENDFKSNLIKMIEAFYQELNTFLKEIQESTTKQVEALEEETNKSLNEIQENTIKQVKEINKPV